MTKVLVLGGAGYIGSVVVKKLIEEKYEVFVVDNLSKGKRELIDKEAKFFEGDILDKEFLYEVFSKNEFYSVMHFAALKDAGESMGDPELYSNNIIGTINVLNAMVKFGVKKIIFSSSAAVYGEPVIEVVDEEHKKEPTNFYGFTKLESERFLEWYQKLKGIDYVALRYFNVAGDGGLGYTDLEAKNIFPVIGQVLRGEKEELLVFGDDFETRDGSGIRDYIHVLDLARAHILALRLEGSQVINLGSEEGYSVFELIKEFEKQSDKKINYEIVNRRDGDCGSVIASSKKAKELLDWNTECGLEDMVKSTIDAYLK